MKLILTTCLLAACTQHENLGDRFALHQARWSVSFGTSAGLSDATAVAVDSAGDVVATGVVTGPTDFGTTTIGTIGVATHWVGKRAGADGSELWTRGLAGTNFQLKPLAVDDDRDVIVGGGYTGTQDFGGKTLSTPQQDAYVALYSADGDLRWVSGLAPGSNAFADSVVVSGDRIFMSARSTTTGFVAAYDRSGQQLWVISLPIGGHLQVAPDGDVLLAGVVPQSTMLGGVSIDLTHDADLFVATVSPTGDISRVSTFGMLGVAHRDLYSCVTSDGDLAATSNGMSVPMGVPDDTLLDASGSTRWTASLAGPAQSLAIASVGDVVITGGHAVGRSFDAGNGLQIGAMYLAARDGAGHLIDSRVFGDPSITEDGGDTFTALAAGPDGELAFAGHIDQAVDFGTGSQPVPAAQTDLVLGMISEP